MNYKLLDTGVASADKNMQLDSQLLETLEQEPLLHLYEWLNPSLTYGYFTDPAEHINLQIAKDQGITLAKRPTGGGIIFHTCDLAFSVLIPANHPAFSVNTLENYAYINTIVIQAIDRFFGGLQPTLLEVPEEQSARTHFCMVKPTVYDVVIEGRKVAGAAQRRTKAGYLHQGSICPTLPDESLLYRLVTPVVAKGILENSFPLLGKNATAFEINDARLQLKNILTEILVK